ncbi:MAG: hypothetical protein ACXWV9_10845 [Flavisolibacter sp.]
MVVFTTSSSKNDKIFCEKYGADMITKPDHAVEYKNDSEYCYVEMHAELNQD